MALAAAAGVAIENARLYASGRRRQRWLEVSADITDVLLGEVDRDQALELVARRAMETAGADLAMVLLRDEATPDGLVVGWRSPLAASRSSRVSTSPWRTTSSRR